MLKYIDKLDSLRLKQNNGVYEPNETELVKRLLKPDHIFVDVGAHIGYYTDIAAGIITDGYIYAFEPWPENFELLKKNANWNNVLLHNYAIADKCTGISKGLMYGNKKNTGDHRSFKTKGENRESIEVKFTPLDYAVSVDRIDFLKIDTQGFEIEVLKSGREIINHSPDINILIEYCPELLKLAGYSSSELIGLIINMGFNIYVHTKRGWLYANSETFLIKHTGHVNLFCSRSRHEKIKWSK